MTNEEQKAFLGIVKKLGDAFDEAAETLRVAAMREGALVERFKIVKWLRHSAEGEREHRTFPVAADEIERLAHLK